MAAAILDLKISIVSRRFSNYRHLIYVCAKNGDSIIILTFTAVTLVKFVEIFKFSLMLSFFDENVKNRYFWPRNRVQRPRFHNSKVITFKNWDINDDITFGYKYPIWPPPPSWISRYRLCLDDFQTTDV